MGRERFVFALAAGLPLAIGLAPKLEASPVNYTFSVTATSGPLAGASATGTFRYDTIAVEYSGVEAQPARRAAYRVRLTIA